MCGGDLEANHSRAYSADSANRVPWFLGLKKIR